MKLRNKSLFGLLMMSASAFAAQGGGAQNGGKTAAAQFEFAVEQIQRWVKRDHLKEIDTKGIPVDVLSQQVVELAQEILDHQVKLNFSDKKQEITIDGKTEEYTCTNTPSTKSIDCNIERWSKTETQQTRYFLTFHEMLGLLGYEQNDGLASEFRISKQLLPYLGTELVLKDFAGYVDILQPTVSRCEGVLVFPGGDWSMKRRKEFIINVFPDGETYVTDMVYPIGSQTPREITGGVRGNRKFKSFGIDKIARYFNGDRYAKAKVSQNGMSTRYEENTSYQIDIHGKRLNILFLDQKMRAATVSYGVGFPGTVESITVPCSGNVAHMSSEEDAKEHAEGIEKFRSYLKALTQKGWVRMNGDLEMEDFGVTHGIIAPPGAPRDFWRTKFYLN